jgi:hypothetical protein
MTRIVKIGAPSLTGKDANKLVADAFAQSQYPLTLTIRNHMPRDVVFPEVPGLFLRHVAHAAESVATVQIASADVLARVTSSIEQVAELNRYRLAVTLSDGEVPAETAGSAAPKPSDGMNLKQLKRALKDKGIEPGPDASAHELAALLDAAPADQGPSGENAGQ